MSKRCWQQQVHSWIRGHQGDGHSPRLAVVGIGHELRGDDAAGVCAARALVDLIGTSPRCISIPAGCAPENCTGQLREFGPEAVLFLDAADMEEMPGTIRWLPPDAADGVSASTHSLPLGVLAGYLAAEIGCDVGLLGIQPECIEMDSPLSPSVRIAVRDICSTLVRALSGEGTSDTGAGTIRKDEVLDPTGIGYGHVPKRWTE
jgi:hydrogenase 3 maturation protease